MKKIFAFIVICGLSFSAYATPSQTLLSPSEAATLSKCAQAEATTSPSFCPSFESVAKCQCIERSPRKEFCQDMKQIYRQMIDLFRTIERACQFQKDTSTQTCIDDWNCFLNGGKDSNGGMCSSTGKACQ